VTSPDDDERDAHRPYRYTDWRADGFRGPPPWRRGYQPGYWALSIAVVALVLTIVVVFASRR
jgi:hypothetical protein